jgi:hypothetical protein
MIFFKSLNQYFILTSFIGNKKYILNYKWAWKRTQFILRYRWLTFRLGSNVLYYPKNHISNAFYKILIQLLSVNSRQIWVTVVWFNLKKNGNSVRPVKIKLLFVLLLMSFKNILKFEDSLEVANHLQSSPVQVHLK